MNRFNIDGQNHMVTGMPKSCPGLVPATAADIYPSITQKTANMAAGMIRTTGCNFSMQGNLGRARSG